MFDQDKAKDNDKIDCFSNPANITNYLYRDMFIFQYNTPQSS